MVDNKVHNNKLDKEETIQKACEDDCHIDHIHRENE